MSLKFEWDPEKALLNEEKHDVSFEEAKTVFDDPLSLTVDDPDHSVGEDRLIAVGMSTRGRVLIVVHAERGDIIRIIGAREADRGERRSHEEGEEELERW